MRDVRLGMIQHPKYSECANKQKAMEDAVDTMTASILDLVGTVIHKRLTQFAELIAKEKR